MSYETRSERGPISPEEIASLYKIDIEKPEHRQNSLPELKKKLSLGSGLRWTLNTNSFTLKIWAHEAYHYAVDPEATQQGASGYVDNKNGVYIINGFDPTTPGNRLVNLKAIKIAIYNKLNL
jgi:hypothetical protein